MRNEWGQNHQRPDKGEVKIKKLVEVGGKMGEVQ
jgi:hypothetical protein